VGRRRSTDACAWGWRRVFPWFHENEERRQGKEKEKKGIRHEKQWCRAFEDEMRL